MDARRSPRFSLEGVVRFKSDSIQGEGRLRDISLEGAAIMSKTLVARSDYLGLTITLPNGTGLIEIDLAPVRWVRGEQFGVEFIRVQPGSQQALHRTLETLASPPG